MIGYLAWIMLSINNRDNNLHTSSHSQPSHSVASVRHHLRPSGGGELGRHGMLDHDPVLDVAVCHHVDSLLPLAYEQEPRAYHVFVILRIRCRFTHV